MIKASKNLLVRIHNLLFVSNYNNKYKLCKKYLLWLATNIGYRTIEFLFGIYLSVYRLLRRYPTPLNADGKFIVSLTSFPARIGKVWIVIDSLMHQTVRPSKICLYLSDEEFPDGRASLPRRLLDYERIGLKICFRSYNLMPHVRYFYALQEYPSYDVITVDDDICYFSDMIENLTKIHTRYPHCVCSNNVMRIANLQSGGTVSSVRDWPWPLNLVEPSLANVAMGYSGVYYPAGVFKNQAAFDMGAIRLLTLRTDDLWLRIHETLEGIPVAGGGYQFPGLSIRGTQKIALKHNNCSNEENNGNDVAWKKLCNHYNINYES